MLSVRNSIKKQKQIKSLCFKKESIYKTEEGTLLFNQSKYSKSKIYDMFAEDSPAKKDFQELLALAFIMIEK